MNSILMILKTQNLNNDQRVIKEINSLRKCNNSVDLFVATDVKADNGFKDINIKYTSILGGPAPKHVLIRILGVFQFYINALFFIFFSKKKYNAIWISDPIMFGLVFLVKILFLKRKFVIWDHHELPPSWFVNNRLLMLIFKFGYQSANIVVHANEPRRKYIENVMNYTHSNGYIISNFPNNFDVDEELLDPKAEEWIKTTKFIYIQNSLNENRFGADIIRCANELGFSVFHAGKVDNKYIKKSEINVSNVFLAGYLTPKQINRALNQCEFTVIFYKQNSLNQVFCDANRLYQAMSVGAPIIIGNNPTLIDATINYRDKIILNFDGGDISALKIAFSKKHFDKKRQAIVCSWNIYDDYFKSISDEIAMEDIS